MLKAPNPNFARMQEIRGRLRKLDAIDTALLRDKTGPYLQPGEVDRRTLGTITGSEEQFKEMARQGLTHRQIADQMGLSKTSVTRKIQNMIDTGQLTHDEIRPQVAAKIATPFERIEELKELIRSGLSQRNIQLKLKIGTETFAREFKKLLDSGETFQPRSSTDLGFGASTPKGLTPSMPQFNFKEPLSKDNFQDYIKALEKHLNDVKAYFNVGPTRSFA
jgi:transposase-like protein